MILATEPKRHFLARAPLLPRGAKALAGRAGIRPQSLSLPGTRPQSLSLPPSPEAPSGSLRPPRLRPIPPSAPVGGTDPSSRFGASLAPVSLSLNWLRQISALWATGAASWEAVTGPHAYRPTLPFLRPGKWHSLKAGPSGVGRGLSRRGAGPGRRGGGACVGARSSSG